MKGMNLFELVQRAIYKAGSQEVLASVLGLNASELSKRINGHTGWAEKEIHMMLAYSGCQIYPTGETVRVVEILKGAFRLSLNLKELRLEPDLNTLIESMRILLGFGTQEKEKRIEILRETIKLLLGNGGQDEGR